MRQTELKIAYDRMTEEYVINGKSLLDLPSNSSAYLSIKKILTKAGHIKH